MFKFFLGLSAGATLGITLFNFAQYKEPPRFPLATFNPGDEVKRFIPAEDKLKAVAREPLILWLQNGETILEPNYYIQPKACGLRDPFSPDQTYIECPSMIEITDR